MIITTQTITRELLGEQLNYASYTQCIINRLEAGRTTNDDNEPSKLEYTRLNIHRSSRWDRKGKIGEELVDQLSEFPYKMIWLVITEGWCGDSAQILPFINKMAELSPNIELKIMLRDEHPAIMDEFLTNGSRSIPKLVALDSDSLEVIGTWGPRPNGAQERYMNERADPGIDNIKATENLHLFYARDKGQAIQKEFLQLLNEWRQQVQN